MLKGPGEWTASLGPWGVFLVALGDSAMVPMPQGVDALVIAQTIAHPSTGLLTAGLAVVGSLLGCLILYAVARRGGRALLERKASSRGVEKMRAQVDRHGAMLLLLPTMLPLPLPTKLFVIAAGVFRMRLLPFAVVVTLGRTVRYGGEALLALRYGERTTGLLRENALAGVAVCLVLVALFLGISRWSTRRVERGE